MFEVGEGGVVDVVDDDERKGTTERAGGLDGTLPAAKRYDFRFG